MPFKKQVIFIHVPKFTLISLPNFFSQSLQGKCAPHVILKIYKIYPYTIY